MKQLIKKPLDGIIDSAVSLRKSIDRYAPMVDYPEWLLRKTQRLERKMKRLSVKYSAVITMELLQRGINPIDYGKE